jgi:arylsulfatase A-like enzyme/CBS domain-containing protein
VHQFLRHDPGLFSVAFFVCFRPVSASYPGGYEQHSDERRDRHVRRVAPQRAGYATAYLGKWHLDGEGKPQWAPERKFGFEDNRYMFNRGHWKQLEDTPDGPRVKTSNADGVPTYAIQGADEQSFATDFLADRTVEFIHAHRERPFCVMLSLPDPHGPDTVRPPYDTMFQDQTYRQPRSALKPDQGLPSWGQKQNGNYDQSKYYGMVKCIDDNVGKILAALRETELLDRTIVVFTADHGDLRGEHHRQNKGVPYEASAKIPLVIAYPGTIPPGQIVHQALGCVDFLPTILGLMGVSTAGDHHGRDASMLLTTGQAPKGWKDVSVLRGTGLEAGWLAAVSPRYKLVVSTSDDPWLFDLEHDPDELVNRFLDPAYRSTVRQLARELAEYGQRYNDPRAANPDIQADLQWAMQGTGEYRTTRPARPLRAKPPRKRKKNRRRERRQDSADPSLQDDHRIRPPLDRSAGGRSHDAEQAPAGSLRRTGASTCARRLRPHLGHLYGRRGVGPGAFQPPGRPDRVLLRAGRRRASDRRAAHAAVAAQRTGDSVAEIMVKEVITLSDQATLLDACECFILHRLLALPIVDHLGRMVGVVDVELYTDEISELADARRATTYSS